MDFSIITQLSDYRDAYVLLLVENKFISCNNHLIPGYYNTIALIFQMSILQYLFFPFIFFRGSFTVIK